MQLRLLTIVCIIASGLIGCGGGAAKEVVQEKYPNGNPKKVSFMKGRVPVKTLFYFDDGKIQSEAFYDEKGQPDSTTTIFYKSGQKYKETHYKNGNQHGSEKAWYEDGTIKMEANYVEGKVEGTVTSNFPNGKKQSEVTYKNGAKDGEEITYDSTGQQLELKTYVAGNKTGIEKKWYPDGTLKEENTYKDNVLDGPYTMYHPNGKKMEEGNYKQGQYDGRRIGYNERGRKIADTKFENGELVDGTAF